MKPSKNSAMSAPNKTQHIAISTHPFICQTHNLLVMSCHQTRNQSPSTSSIIQHPIEKDIHIFLATNKNISGIDLCHQCRLYQNMLSVVNKAQQSRITLVSQPSSLWAMQEVTTCMRVSNRTNERLNLNSII
jgi:hypothetical protein